METKIGNLAVSLAVMVFSVFPSMAQVSHSVLDASREEKDLRVEKIKHKLDSIRTVRHRPTVALVLSGGGAKGAAHVGVIKYLESIGMPVDIVMGTSMGGLVGGIYALGYDADHLDSIIRNINWDMALSDKVPRDYLSYSSIKYKEKYALSFPFLYDSKEYLQMRESGGQYVRRVDDIHFGAGQADATNMVKDNLLGSLPSGMVRMSTTSSAPFPSAIRTRLTSMTFRFRFCVWPRTLSPVRPRSGRRAS